MKTYTILDAQGEVRYQGLGLSDAAVEIMLYDGHDFEIRAGVEDDGGFVLWTTRHSRNSTLGSLPMTQSTIFSLEDDEKEATDDIFRQVIANSGWWSNQTVMLEDA